MDFSDSHLVWHLPTSRHCFLVFWTHILADDISPQALASRGNLFLVCTFISRACFFNSRATYLLTKACVCVLVCSCVCVLVDTFSRQFQLLTIDGSFQKGPIIDTRWLVSSNLPGSGLNLTGSRINPRRPNKSLWNMWHFQAKNGWFPAICLVLGWIRLEVQLWN